MSKFEEWFQDLMTAGDWRTCWGCGVYLIYAPFILIALVAGYFWRQMWERLYDRYEWLYSVIDLFFYIPGGPLLLVGIFIAMTSGTGLALCVFLWKRTPMSNYFVGRMIIGLMGAVFVSIGVGIFFSGG